MGYISKDIAVITEPDIVTLSAVPNFIQFESKAASKTYLEVNIQVNITRSPAATVPSKTLLRITDSSGIVHTYHGTTVAEDVSGSTFYVAALTSDTTENLRQVLLADKWFNANFSVVIPFTWDTGNPRNGSILTIKSKGAGTDFNITIEAPNNTDDVAYTLTWINPTSENNDSISGEASTTEIDLDIYTDPEVFLGQDDRPITPQKIGTYVTTLQKTYAGVPVWFELNALFAQYGGYNRPPGTSGWFDTGTLRTYRFTAKVKAINSFYFYQSNALYVLHGYGPASESLDLDQFIYNDRFFSGITNIDPDHLWNLPTTGAPYYTYSPDYDTVWVQIFEPSGTITVTGVVVLRYNYFNGVYPSSENYLGSTGTTIPSKAKLALLTLRKADNPDGYDSMEITQSGTGITSNEKVIRLLTNKPRTPYIRGQKEYLNFIFSDPQRGESDPTEFTLRVAYRAYTTSDNYLGTVYGQEKARADFAIVNTCQLDIDTVLDQYPTAGIIRVTLARGTALVSNDQEYTIRPECLHTLRQFSFINRLGGWDAFNFDAGIKDEIKPSVETYNKTLTPSYQKGDSVETVYSTALANTLTIEGAPVSDEVANWLKELAAARVILDDEGNYVIIEDFTLSKTDAAFNMQRPTIKYRLSENYTND